jgi:hypothetical protein
VLITGSYFKEEKFIVILQSIELLIVGEDSSINNSGDSLVYILECSNFNTLIFDVP